jgi:hypothetical protein
MTFTVSLTFPVTDQLCADILCAALEGGIGYWAFAEKIDRAESGDQDYLSATLSDAENEDAFPEFVCNYDTIRLGITRALAKPTWVVYRNLVQAISLDDASALDAADADVIVQLGAFDELVFG